MNRLHHRNGRQLGGWSDRMTDQKENPVDSKSHHEVTDYAKCNWLEKVSIQQQKWKTVIDNENFFYD